MITLGQIPILRFIARLRIIPTDFAGSSLRRTSQQALRESSSWTEGPLVFSDGEITVKEESLTSFDTFEATADIAVNEVETATLDQEPIAIDAATKVVQTIPTHNISCPIDGDIPATSEEPSASQEPKVETFTPRSGNTSLSLTSPSTLSAPTSPDACTPPTTVPSTADRMVRETLINLPCLQCAHLKLPCDERYPTCRRCQRRLAASSSSSTAILPATLSTRSGRATFPRPTHPLCPDSTDDSDLDLDLETAPCVPRAIASRWRMRRAGPLEAGCAHEHDDDGEQDPWRGWRRDELLFCDDVTRHGEGDGEDAREAPREAKIRVERALGAWKVAWEQRRAWAAPLPKGFGEVERWRWGGK